MTLEPLAVLNIHVFKILVKFKSSLGKIHQTKTVYIMFYLEQRLQMFEQTNITV